MKSNVNDLIVNEISKYQELLIKGTTRANTSGEWSSISSSTAYAYTSETDLMNQLKIVLDDYLISATNYNDIITRLLALEEWMNEMAGYTDFTFHDAVTATGDGNKFTVDKYKSITFGISGTSTSRTIQFRGIDIEGNDDLLNAFDRDFVQATGTTANNETWVVDVTGYDKFYCKITAISGGNVTITGRAVT